MKILLTGGSGFIGKNILESYLADKYTIVAPRSSELDISNQESVDQFFVGKQFDVVIHSAVKPGHRNANDLSALFNTNVRMFYNLAKHRASYGKFINIGSGAIYDLRNYKPKMPESYAGVHIPVDDHGLCKYVVEKQIETLDNFVDLRIFGIFGRYEDYAIRFISNAICKTIFDLPITLKQNRKFDYLYVDDLYTVLEYFIENTAKYKSYNITPDKSIELLELAKIVRNISGKNDLAINVASPGFGLEYSGDNSRLLHEFQTLKLTAINDSIKNLYQWYNSRIEMLDRQKLVLDK